ncbi:MAG: YraN family protein [Dongiaceae bacterium]
MSDRVRSSLRPAEAGRQRRRERQRNWGRGRRGERLAAWWLRLKGYRIVACDLRCPVGEIDLIARRGQTLAIVEVKARPDRAAAAEAVSARQRQRILAALGWYLARHPERSQDRIRFDAILIVPRRLPQHIEDCWQGSHTG